MASLADVYVRDNVNDTGAPHTGPLSLSPDIIVKQAPVMNPQDEFGENSGTESNANLSDDVEYGQNNYLYIRVMNRGMEAAQQVTAEVFWSEVATLITPDQWNSIGQTTIQSVPPGDVLTVSSPITWLANDIRKRVPTASSPASAPNWNRYRITRPSRTGTSSSGSSGTGTPRSYRLCSLH